MYVWAIAVDKKFFQPEFIDIFLFLPENICTTWE